MAGSKIAVFEEINPSLSGLVLNLLKEGFIIYPKKINKKLMQEKEIKNALELNRIIPMSKVDFGYGVTLQSQLNAHKNLDEFFDKHYAHSPSIRTMQVLLKFPEITDMYRKITLEKMQESYLLEIMTNHVIEKEKPEEARFYFLNNGKIHLDALSLLDKKIKVVDANTLSSKIRLFARKTAYLGYSFYLIFKKLNFSKKTPKEFKVGITIKHPKNIFLMNYYTESVLIDEKEFPKEDVLFIDESGNVNVADYKKRGYNYTRFLDDRQPFSGFLMKKLLVNFLPAWFRSVFSVFDDWIIVYGNSKILMDYVAWSIFLDNFKIENHVRWVLPDYPSRTHILSSSGVRTWFIRPDNYTSDYHSGWDESVRLATLHSFLHYDYAVIYGNKVKRYFQNLRNSIKHYVVNGFLFSQIDDELMEGKLKSPLPGILKNKGFDKLKVIGVFDSSYTNLAPFNQKDGIRFGGDILNLLEENPELCVIFKAKKQLEITPELIPAYTKLKNHERCLFIARYDELGISAPEVIAFSNLVITIPFTSTTAEALCSGKKAFYYDVSSRHAGDNYYYNKFPKFVAHDYKELENYVDFWLNLSNADFDSFLEKYVRGEIDPYLDCKALTRLRCLLMGKQSV